MIYIYLDLYIFPFLCGLKVEILIRYHLYIQYKIETPNSLISSELEYNKSWSVKS